MHTRYKFSRFYLIILFFLPKLLFGTNVCPPDTGTNCSAWISSTYQTTTEQPDCLLTVNYRWRNCNGNYQIYVDNYTSQGNCEYLVQSGSSFQEWINLVLIEELINLEGQGSPVNCPDSTTKAVFYSSGCGLLVKCEYTIDSVSRVCDVDWRGSYPDYSSNGIQKISKWKYQSCGVSCCKKTYTICKSYGVGTNSYEIHINAVKTERIGACSNPEGYVTPCEDGCQ